MPVADPRRLAARDVGDRQQARAAALRLLHGGQGVGRLARLGDPDRQHLAVDDRLAVAVLGAVVDLHRDAGQALDQELADQAACHEVPQASRWTRSIARQAPRA